MEKTPLRGLPRRAGGLGRQRQILGVVKGPRGTQKTGPALTGMYAKYCASRNMHLERSPLL